MSGRPFLQIPGPTNVPDRVLRAMDRAVIDHRSPAFAALVKSLLPGAAQAVETLRQEAALYGLAGTDPSLGVLRDVLPAFYFFANRFRGSE